MSNSTVTLTIEGRQVTVPEGTLLVDAAKMAGVYIPVFCYHPKMEPVGMCRMCLVEIGRPEMDRETGQFKRDENGELVIQYGQNTETACTQPVGEGWVVKTTSEKALKSQSEIVEFLLTSHPLDCPVCDKGGECPLQELTMDFGSGKSRFHYGDKMHLGKHVPLGDLIFLDQERCIQCARCTRFQDEIVDDPVLGFEERARKLQIVTYSEPGFDSIFSGNTTDICPVGALTTADFRFEARPWELKAAASICTHCPVGCNTMVNTRREPKAEGRVTVQRIMPRQNESVNEIWLCDKGRFGHHYAGPKDRLNTPMLRKDGVLTEVSWDEALAAAAQGLKEVEGSVLGVAGGRVSNEDFFTFRQVVEALGGMAALADDMAGGDWAAAYGPGKGTNLGDLGEGDAVLIVASDLHQEAPIWWLRLKQAAERGAKLVVANARSTRLDKHAGAVVRYAYPLAAQAVNELRSVVKTGSSNGSEELRRAAEVLQGAENLLVFFGREGLDRKSSEALAGASAELLKAVGRTGMANNGLVPVWPHNNTQGGWDMGLRPAEGGLKAAASSVSALWLVAADPVEDQPGMAELIEAAEFVVVQELYLTDTAQQADVVLPASSYLEREGTFTTGDRRLQRFYPVLPPFAESKPDWKIAAEIGAKAGFEIEARAPSLVLQEAGEFNPAYAGITYQDLAQTEKQWPRVGGEHLYFGGTAYSNQQGLGVELPSAVEREEAIDLPLAEPSTEAAEPLTLVPVDRLYDHGRTVTSSELLHPRLTCR
ncbi:MAG: NADH-quinone oxidoreductase subunit NuoG [Anaerolineales bacterium]